MTINICLFNRCNSRYVEQLCATVTDTTSWFLRNRYPSNGLVAQAKSPNKKVTPFPDSAACVFPEKAGVFL